MLISSTTLNGGVGNDSNNNITMSVGNTVIANVNSTGMYFEAGKKAIYTGAMLQATQYLRAANFTSGSTMLATTSATYADIMSNAITTTITNSKILVLCSCVGYYGSGALRAAARLERNGTLLVGDPYAWYAPQATMATYTAQVLDTPNVAAGTTLTYTLRGSNQGGAGTMYLGYADSGGGATNTITLLEIAP